MGRSCSSSTCVPRRPPRVRASPCPGICWASRGRSSKAWALRAGHSCGLACRLPRSLHARGPLGLGGRQPVSDGLAGRMQRGCSRLQRLLGCRQGIWPKLHPTLGVASLPLPEACAAARGCIPEPRQWSGTRGELLCLRSRFAPSSLKMDAAVQVLLARHGHHSGAVLRSPASQITGLDLTRQPAAACRPAHQRPQAACAAAAVEAQPVARNEGHSALLSGLGAVGDVSASHVPWLLRIAHVRQAPPWQAPRPSCALACSLCDWLLSWEQLHRSSTKGGDSQQALKDNARGLCLWKARPAPAAAALPCRPSPPHTPGTAAHQPCLPCLGTCGRQGLLAAGPPRRLRRWPWSEAWPQTTRQCARLPWSRTAPWPAWP